MLESPGHRNEAAKAVEHVCPRLPVIRESLVGLYFKTPGSRLSLGPVEGWRNGPLRPDRIPEVQRRCPPEVAVSKRGFVV